MLRRRRWGIHHEERWCCPALAGSPVPNGNAQERSTATMRGATRPGHAAPAAPTAAARRTPAHSCVVRKPREPSLKEMMGGSAGPNSEAACSMRPSPPRQTMKST